MGPHRRQVLTLLAAGTGALAGCRTLPSRDGTPTEGTPATTATPQPASAVGCPDADTYGATHVVCSQNPPEEGLVFEPTPETASLPTATVDCRLENTLDESFASNFYDWKLHRYKMGTWHFLGPFTVPMPLHGLAPGETHVRRLHVDNSDLSRIRPPAPEATPAGNVMTTGLVGLGPGAYAIGIGSGTEQEGTIYSASFTLKGDPVPLVQPRTVTDTSREGNHVNVEVNSLHDETDRFDLTVHRRANPSAEPHPLIDEVLYLPQFVGFRAAFANLEPGVETVTVRGDDSQMTRNLSSGGTALRFVSYQGATFELQLGAPTDGPVTGEYDLAGGWRAYAADARNSGHRETPLPQRGREAWRFEVSGRIYDGPAVGGDLVFVPSTDGNIYAATAANGEEVWRFPVQGQARVTPAIVGETLYAAGRSGSVYAIDAQAGTEHWTFTGNGEGYALSHPSVKDGTVYIGDTGGTLYAIDAATGQKDWDIDTGDMISSSPAVGPDRIYVGWRAQPENPEDDAKGGLDAISKDGTRSWRIRPGNIDGSPTIVDGTVYAGSENGLLALDPATGDRLWKFDRGAVDSPAVADGIVYVGTRNGNLHAINATSGKEQWSFASQKWADTAPAVGADAIAFSSWDDRVYGVESNDGTERWRVELETPLSDPAIEDGVVYVASNKSLIAIRDER